jgi:hypothetical protein
MADVNQLGGASRPPVNLPCIPDATFLAEILVLIAAGTKVVGKLVQLTWAVNNEVTSPAANAIPDGEIIAMKKVTRAAGATYLLTVNLFHYPDQNGTSHTPAGTVELEYSGTLALQDSVICVDTAYRAVDDGTTGGWGAVVSLNTSTSKAVVLV